MDQCEESIHLSLDKYHFYERRTDKVYTMGKYDYGHGERTYEFNTCSVSLNGPWWIIAKEVLDDSDREQLQTWCRCDICKMFVLNPNKWMACAHCYHCLKYGGNDQKVIDDSRAYKSSCST